jgi:cyanophycinase
MTSTLNTKVARALLAIVPLLAVDAAHAGPKYTYSYVGSPSTPVRAKPVSCVSNVCTPSVVLMGGGYDVAEAFRWMIAQAGITRATGGRFVIIRATGSDAYNPYVYSRLGTVDTSTSRNYEMVGGIDLGVTSVETLVIPSRTAAADPFVLDVIGKASAIFIAGGDQADYYNDWQSTPLAAALQRAVDAGIPVGGTSAGNAMLGQYAFAALNDTVTSDEALANPFNRYMTIDPLNTWSGKFTQTGSFISIPGLEKTITDDHFNTRDRLGRLIGFVARIGDGCPGGVERFDQVLGIGVDEETAVLVSGPRGGARAQLVANPYNPENTTAPYAPQNSAYFTKVVRTPAQCAAKKTLDINGGVQVYRLSAQPAQPSPYPSAPQYSFRTNATFNLATWTQQTPQTYADGSSLNGPFVYGTAGGAILGNQVR